MEQNLSQLRIRELGLNKATTQTTELGWEALIGR